MLERRSLLKLGTSAIGAGLIGAPTLAFADIKPTLPVAAPPIAAATSPATPIAAPASAPDFRCVSMQNLHTGESLQGVYWDGGYVPEVLDAVNVHLRDYRTGDVHTIDPALLDLLDAVSTLTETKSPFQVISGFRSAKTNAMLHERSDEVAKKSFHIQGMAIDIRLPDVELAHLHAAALSLGRGGVGYYPDSNFVHIDVGPVRTWQGA